MSNFLFDNQVTKEELKALSKKTADALRGIMETNLDRKVEEKVMLLLSSPCIADEDQIDITYIVKANLGMFAAWLGTIRQENQRKKK